MDSYLIKHVARIGRTKEDGADLPPVEVVFYALVKAKDAEAASDMAVGYQDKGFVVDIADVSKAPDFLQDDAAFELFKATEVLRPLKL